MFRLAQSLGGAGTGAPAGGKWAMKRLPKGAVPEEKREHAKGDGDGWTRMVVKHTMLSRACKRVVYENEEEDLAELIYGQHGKAELKPLVRTTARRTAARARRASATSCDCSLVQRICVRVTR